MKRQKGELVRQMKKIADGLGHFTRTVLGQLADGSSGGSEDESDDEK
jgi:hypothetical protein